MAKEPTFSPKAKCSDKVFATAKIPKQPAFVKPVDKGPSAPIMRSGKVGK
jgi:hypothetical protein